MSKNWYPSNGTEGMAFIGTWCDRCRRETWDPETDTGHKCSILTNSFLEDEVREWQLDDNGNPICTKFSPYTELVNKGGGYRRKEKLGQQVLDFSGKDFRDKE